MEQFKIETERVLRIGEALGRGDGDLSGCLMPDLKHVCEILGRVAVLQDLAPGFLDETFHIWIPHFIKMHNKAQIGAMAQSKADAAGFGADWRAVIEAGNSPRQKDYMAQMVALQMKLTGCNQAQAIKGIAEQSGRDEESLRRSVTKSKARKK